MKPKRTSTPAATKDRKIKGKVLNIYRFIVLDVLEAVFFKIITEKQFMEKNNASFVISKIAMVDTNIPGKKIKE